LRFMKIMLLILFPLTLTTCYRKDFFHAPDEFIPYVEKFITAGNKRGILIQPGKEGLIIEFGVLENHQLGKSKPNHSPQIITINQAIWPDLDTFQRKALIFHELGHCLLQRKHRNQLLPNGECASLLAGKENGFQCLPNLYSGLWWNYYVDELFNPALEQPTWYTDELSNYRQDFQKTYLMNAVNPIFQLDTSIQTTILKKHFKNSVGKRGGWFFLDMNCTRNYQIEVTYQTNKEDNKTYRILWNDLNFLVAHNHLSIKTTTLRNTQVIWGLSTSFFQQKLVQNNPSKKLTIKKYNTFLYFFFNEKIVHIIEADYPKGQEKWLLSHVDKTVLKTNFIYENETALKVEVAYLD